MNRFGGTVRDPNRPLDGASRPAGHHSFADAGKPRRDRGRDKFSCSRSLCHCWARTFGWWAVCRGSSDEASSEAVGTADGEAGRDQAERPPGNAPLRHLDADQRGDERAAHAKEAQLVQWCTMSPAGHERHSCRRCDLNLRLAQSHQDASSGRDRVFLFQTAAPTRAAGPDPRAPIQRDAACW